MPFNNSTVGSTGLQRESHLPYKFAIQNVKIKLLEKDRTNWYTHLQSPQDLKRNLIQSLLLY